MSVPRCIALFLDVIICSFSSSMVASPCIVTVLASAIFLISRVPLPLATSGSVITISLFDVSARIMLLSDAS